MADHCVFCDTRRPEGGTNILVLGDNWVEFCGPCGDKETVINDFTKEQLTVRQLFDREPHENLEDAT